MIKWLLRIGSNLQSQLLGRWRQEASAKTKRANLKINYSKKG
jgi:hypothetical protein